MNRPRLIRVIESWELHNGDGTKEDQTRTIVRYYTVDGEFLAERDPAPEPQLPIEFDGVPET